MARRTFPSKLKLKSFFGSGKEAPQAQVSFTTCLYDYAAQTMPSWEKTGVPGLFGGHDDVKAGRTRPAAEFLEELREKHGFPLNGKNKK